MTRNFRLAKTLPFRLTGTSFGSHCEVPVSARLKLHTDHEPSSASLRAERGNLDRHAAVTARPQAAAIRTAQGGFVLLEALIGILIFAVGVLAVVGLQAMSIKDVADAKYRTDAALLANELISDAWINSKSFSTMQGAYNSPSGSYYTTTWLGDVANQLPGVTAASNAPTVLVTQAGSAIQLTVTVNWQLP